MPPAVIPSLFKTLMEKLCYYTCKRGVNGGASVSGTGTEAKDQRSGQDGWGGASQPEPCVCVLGGVVCGIAGRM